MKTIAIIPALNEYERLQSVLTQILLYVDTALVVDDGSNRPLSQYVRNNDRTFVVRHSINLGKGAALKTGMCWAIERHYDVAVFIDADGQHDPAEIPRLIAPITSGQAKIVFGIRQFHRTMPLLARIGNVFLTKMIGLLFGIHVHDTQSGYRAVDVRAFPELDWTSSRYSVETEMIVNAGKHNVAYAEVPVSTIYHDKYRGTTVIDGIRIFLHMLNWKML